MSIDAGTIYASIRVKLGDLKNDVKSGVASMEAFAKSVDDAGKSVEKLNKLGSQMSLKVTAPILAAGVASVKFASDFSESVGGVETVFGEFAGKIKTFASTAAKSAGLSMTEVNEAATVLGTSLQNAGYSMGESADIALTLTQRAADMAALFGTDVPQAMDAIKAALRGEADPIEKFGVAVNDTSIKAYALKKALWSGSGEMTAHAKAAARLGVIMEQTARAEGRFAEESSGVGGASKVTTAEVKNLAIQIGTDLLPVAKDILEAFKGVVEGLNSLDPATRKTIITIAALAAGIGPAILGVAKMTEAITALKVAFVALSANPIGIALTAVAAGLVIVTTNVKNASQATTKYNGVLKGQLDYMQKIFENNPASMYKDANDMIDDMSKRLGITKESVLEVALASRDMFPKEWRSALLNYRRQLHIAAAQEKGITGEKAEQVQLSEKEQAQINARKQAENAYLVSVKEINDKRNLGLLDSTQSQEALNKAQSEYADALIKLGYADKDEKGTYGQAALMEMIALLDEYKEKQKYLSLEEEAYQGLIKETSNMTEEQKDLRLSAILDEINASDLAIEQKKVLIDLIREQGKETDKTAKKTVDWQTIQEDGIKRTLSGFESVGQAIADSTLGWNTFAKMGLTAIASVLEAIGAELAALAAKEILLAGFFNPAGWAASAWGLAESAAAYTSAGVVRGYAGQFADGGIVPGSSFTGDKLMASVNSGERIYTAEQNAKIDRIFNAIESAGGVSDTVIPITLKLDGKIVARSTTRYQRTGKV